MISLQFNRSDYRVIFIFTGLMTVWLVLKFWTEEHPLDQILFDIPIIILKTLAALFMLRWLAQKFIAERQYYTIFILLAILTLIVTGFIDMIRDYFGSGQTWSDMPSINRILVQSFYYSSADLAMPFLVIMIKKYFENQAQLAKIKEQQKDSELKLLRSQLSPHFLFNNLNTVDALIDTNPKQAKEYIARLSSLYRYLISSKDEDVVSLASEIAMANDYFYLIKTRFGEVYTFDINTNDLAFAKAYLPSGALQTVIENVVKHNKVVHGNSINTSLEVTDTAITLINTKSKTKSMSDESLGTGLKNLKERYKLLLDTSIAVVETATHFKVTLPLVQLTTAED